ncbi:MAG: hypothetical protein MGG11_00740 [Trichodesmium sp. MAG_R03]|nr:hypothetical protein [Trichodesmium sp. MAG_R03]
MTISKNEWSLFLSNELKLPSPKYGTLNQDVATKYFLLPSSNSQPLPSPELGRYLETEPPEATEWQLWEIDCYHLTLIIKLLNEIHFLCLYNVAQVQLGADLLFWYHYSQSFKSIIFKDQYIPALKYRELEQTNGRRKKNTPFFEIYPTWEIISLCYEDQINYYLEYMPLACISGFDQGTATLEFYDQETLLRHFSECLLNKIVTEAPIPAVFEKKLTGSRLLTGCLSIQSPQPPWSDDATLREYQKWQTWKKTCWCTR